MSSQRLFVALPVPAHVRTLITAAAAPARDAAPELTWTRSEGWHLTLGFLGDVADEAVADVGRVIAAVVAPRAAITCALDRPDRFGHRTLWLGVRDDPDGAISSLGDAVQGGLEAAGLPVRPRPVRPHLTLARASRTGAEVSDAVVGSVAPVGASWEADEVQLVRSHLGGGPARYEPVGAWPLAGS